MIISRYNFEYNPDLKNPKSIYPQLANEPFVMSLQTNDGFYSAVVMYDFVTGGINLQVFNPKGELAQTRLSIIPNTDLLFIEGYSLKWYPLNNQFVFERV